MLMFRALALCQSEPVKATLNYFESKHKTVSSITVFVQISTTVNKTVTDRISFIILLRENVFSYKNNKNMIIERMGNLAVTCPKDSFAYCFLATRYLHDCTVALVEYKESTTLFSGTHIIILSRQLISSSHGLNHRQFKLLKKIPRADGSLVTKSPSEE